MIRRGAYALVWVLIGTALVGWATSHETPWVRLRLTPAMQGLSGHPLTIDVFVPHHPENRVLAVALDCDTYLRSWQEQLHGNDGQAEFLQSFDPMPEGRCTVDATVFRVTTATKDGTTERVVVHRGVAGHVCFIGPNESCASAVRR